MSSHCNDGVAICMDCRTYDAAEQAELKKIEDERQESIRERARQDVRAAAKGGR